ncbi:hypothetical protein HDU76_007977 [Blyttiomyces sp. JEL0837]|nr:hypothetical protein HDU76_007977 [Blyttiomyces sp. JEL0837]
MTAADSWNGFAALYGSWESKITLPHAIAALDQIKTDLDHRISSSSDPIIWADIACGTGEFIFELLDRISKDANLVIRGSDFSKGMVDLVKSGLEKRGISEKRVVVEVTDGQNLALESASVDFASCIFGVFLMPNGLKCLTELSRILKPSGKLIFTTWYDTYLIDLLLNVLARINPTAAQTARENPLPPSNWSQPTYLESIFKSPPGPEYINLQSLNATVSQDCHVMKLSREERRAFAEYLDGAPGVQRLCGSLGWTEQDRCRFLDEMLGYFDDVYGVDTVIELEEKANVVVCVKNVE